MLRRTCGWARAATLCLMLGGMGVVVASAIACTEPMAPLPPGAVEWTPPARFALWWRMTESCSGRQGDLRAIRWYIVPGATSMDVNGQRVQGETIGTDKIILVDSHRLDGSLVRHEMLHALLGVGGHPRDAYLVACNDIVVCDGACEVEAGGRPEPPVDAVELTPRDVGARIEIVPREPVASQDSGAVAMIVSITNPLATPAWVRLSPRDSSDPLGDTFGIAIDYNDGGRCCAEWANNAILGTRFPLAARETRRWVWEGDLLAGEYGIRAWFNADTTARVVLDVRP